MSYLETNGTTDGFIDGDPWGLVGVLHIEASSAPSGDFEVTLPASKNVEVFLAARSSTGERGPTMRPKDRTDDAATFVVHGIGDFDEIVSTDFGGSSLAVARVVQILPDAPEIMMEADRVMKAVALGKSIDATSLRIELLPGASVVLEDRNGTEFIAEGPAADNGKPVDASTSISFNGGAVKLGLAARFSAGDSDALGEVVGSLSIVTKGPLDQVIQEKEPHRIVTARDILLDDLGTAFTITGNHCPSDPSRSITRLEVQQGDVKATTKSGAPMVHQGKVAKACNGCENKEKPGCCDPGNCPSGCCSSSDICVVAPANADACGHGGGECVACPEHSECSPSFECSTCDDKSKNGSETDVDCGGFCAQKCGNGKARSIGADCVNHVCQEGICTIASCNDGAKNGSETDVDCGGSCPACGDGKACGTDTDCTSLSCIAGFCEPATCFDNVQNGDETGVDCGPPACQVCPTVLILAGRSQGLPLLVGEVHPGLPTSSGVIVNDVDATDVAPSIAITADGHGIGLIHSVFDNKLRYTHWIAGGSWSPFVLVGPAFSVTGSPNIRAVLDEAHATYQDGQSQYYYAGWKSGWSPAQQNVGNGGAASAQIVGRPSSPASAGATIGFVSAASTVASRNRSAATGTWAANKSVPPVVDATVKVPPDIIRLSSGPELMMVWVENSGKLRFSLRTSDAWSAAVDIPGAMTDITIPGFTLAELPNGGAILAFRDTLDHLQYIVYTKMSGWGMAAPVYTSMPNTVITSTPAITHGIAGAGAELAYVSGGKVYTTRFFPNQMPSWENPVLFPGMHNNNINHVAIASAP